MLLCKINFTKEIKGMGPFLKIINLVSPNFVAKIFRAWHLDDPDEERDGDRDLHLARHAHFARPALVQSGVAQQAGVDLTN
jgi:hypothetical protein